MRLVDLNPGWVGAGGEGVTDADGNPVPERHGVGVSCDCPCGCATRLFVPFANPLDGDQQYDRQGWQRTGDTFETLTLTPSIHRIRGCANSWHGYLTDGVFRSC